jgi:opacity protein-like surface antigen
MLNRSACVRLKTLHVVALFALVVTHNASAQQPSPVAQPEMLNWDTDGGIGWLGREDAEWNTRTPADVQSNWGLAAYHLGFGRYWTRHLKTEASVTAVPGEFGLFDVETIPVVGLPNGGDVFTDKRSTLTQMTLGGTYQFRDNAFATPFVTAGLHVEWLRVHRSREARTYTVGTGASAVRYTAPALDERHTEVGSSPFVGGGLKFYVNRRVFIRPEYRMSFGGAISESTVRIGFGMDF